jgi:hypothetical protein
MSGDLERRYRRVLRLLPGYYRAQWEQDMVARGDRGGERVWCGVVYGQRALGLARLESLM